MCHKIEITDRPMQEVPYDVMDQLNTLDLEVLKSSYPSAQNLEIKSELKTSLDTQVGGNHYKKYAIQPIEYCQKNRLNHCESSIIKYATRHQDKNGAEDVRKIIHYAQVILEMEYGVKE